MSNLRPPTNGALALLVTMLATASACSGRAERSPVASAGPDEAMATSVPARDSAVPSPSAHDGRTTPPAPSGGGLEGTWASPSCGARGYERVLVLRDGGFQASDRVSPCPPGARCAWSGIVQRGGVYRLEGETVSLSLANGVREDGPGAPLPSQLRFEAGVLSEAGPEGARCAYARQ
jgi:hypothetical protein